MGSSPLILFAAMGGVMLLTFGGGFALVVKFFRPVPSGTVLIVQPRGAAPLVTFTGAMVLPISAAESLDITVRTIEIDRSGSDALLCKDGARAEVQATFWVRVDKSRDSVLHVAQTLGCERANDPKQVDEHFRDKFTAALDAAASAVTFTQLFSRRTELVDSVIRIIGTDLGGFCLDDIAVRRVAKLER